MLTVACYSVIPYLVSSLNIDLIHARTLPYRDNNKFFLNPNKRGYYGDRKFGQEILELSERNSVVFADFTIYTILDYLIKIEHVRPDVTLIYCNEKTNIRKKVDTITREKADTPMYIADNNDYYNLRGIEENYVVKNYASFFEIKDKP